MQLDDVLEALRERADRSRLEGMARHGIDTSRALGVSLPEIRTVARSVGRRHALAQQLWATETHEARILASMVDEPERVTPSQMDRRARDFASWDVCGQVCSNLFVRTPHAYAKAARWSSSRAEFVKRAAFSLMASLAAHDKDADDDAFVAFLPLIVAGSSDERNFVKKSVNWALRQIGKRGRRLNASAIATAEEIRAIDSRAARWIAADSLRELRSEAVEARLVGSARTRSTR
jgi:3-methyladenine DNA glycosylase AlkD